MQLKAKVRFEKGFREWEKNDPKISKKILKLVSSILENPFKGVGKPEPLKHEFSGLWSRRINRKNRLVYLVEGETVILISCLGHYE